MASVKAASQLKTTDVHTTRGAISRVRRIGNRILVNFTGGGSRLYHASEHVSVN